MGRASGGVRALFLTVAVCCVFVLAAAESRHKAVDPKSVLDLGDDFDRETSSLMNSLDAPTDSEKEDEKQITPDGDSYDNVDVDNIINQVGSDLAESVSQSEKEEAVLKGDKATHDNGVGGGDGLKDADLFADADALANFKPDDSQLRMAEPKDTDEDNDDDMTGGADDGADEKDWQAYEHAVEMRKSEKKEAADKEAREQAKEAAEAKLRAAAEAKAEGSSKLAAVSPKGKWFHVKKSSDDSLLYSSVTPGAQATANDEDSELMGGGDQSASDLEEELGGNQDEKWDDPNYQPFKSADKEVADAEASDAEAAKRSPAAAHKLSKNGDDDDSDDNDSDGARPVFVASGSDPSPTNGDSGDAPAAKDEDEPSWYSSVSGATQAAMVEDTKDTPAPDFSASDAGDDDETNGDDQGDSAGDLPEMDLPEINLKMVPGSPEELAAEKKKAARASPAPTNDDLDDTNGDDDDDDGLDSEEWYHPPGDPVWQHMPASVKEASREHSRPHFAKAESTAHLQHANGMSEEAAAVPDLMGLLSEDEEQFVLPPESMYGHIPGHVASVALLQEDESDDDDDDGSSDDNGGRSDGPDGVGEADSDSDSDSDSDDGSDDAPWMTDADVQNLDDSDENNPLESLATVLDTDHDGKVVSAKAKLPGPAEPEMIERVGKGGESAAVKAAKRKLDELAGKKKKPKHHHFEVMRSTTWQVKKGADGDDKLVTKTIKDHPKTIIDDDFATELDEKVSKKAGRHSHPRDKGHMDDDKRVGGGEDDDDVQVQIVGAKLPQEKLEEVEKHIEKKLRGSPAGGKHKTHKTKAKADSERAEAGTEAAPEHHMSISDMDHIENIISDVGPSKQKDVIQGYFSRKAQLAKEAKEKFKETHGTEEFVVNHSKAQARQQMRHAGLVIAHGASSFKALPGFQGNGLIPTESASSSTTVEDAVYNSQPLTDNSVAGFQDAGSNPFPNLHVALKPDFYHKEE